MEIQLQLDFGERQIRSIGLRHAETNIFRHDPALETQTHPGEFQIDAPSMQCCDQPRLEKIRQADLV